MMLNWKYIKCASVGFFCLLLIGCDSDYTRMVKSELAKGVRQDSIFLGIKFGNTREEFYGRCFDLNEQKLVTQGVGFSVKYMIQDSVAPSSRDIAMLFYPTFDTLQIIKGMDVEFLYPGWGPSRRELQSDSLSLRVQKILVDWYKGNDFVIVRIDEKDTPIKVDGNRRILMQLEDEQRVLVHIQDLLHPDYRHEGVYVNADMERKR